MRRISVVFLMFAIAATPAVADNVIKFKSDAIEGVIQNRVDASHRVATANEYEKQMDPSTGAISVIGMYKVCAAAGFDIAETDGYASCRNFISEIAAKSGFGTGSATQQNCVSLFNGVWTLSPDGKKYQCVGRDGHKLVYQKSCDGAGGECVKQFAKLQTQGPVGREFIMAWADMHKLPLTCYGEYETRRDITSPLGQDYIMCSAGGKSYEFEFDSLNQDPGTKSVKSENTTMCELYGGTIIDTGDTSIEKVWQSCDVPRDVCNDKLDNLARRIGHTTQYQGYCRLSRDVKSTGIADLKQIDGVDSRIFYNAGQMRADMAKVQLEQYLRTQFPNESHINCDTNIREFNFGLGLDIDYILRCTVGSRQVDFIFDDLTEAFGYEADAGAAGMACIINGGRFSGKHCRGLTQSECTSASLRIPGGTRWDASAGACLLNDVARAAQINNGITIASGVVITVLTFGTASLVVVAAEVGASIAIDLAFTGLERLNETAPHHAALAFMRDAADCADNVCAYSVVANHFAKIDEIASDLNDDELAVVAARIDEISDLLSDEEFERAVSQTKNTVNASGATLGLMTISMLANPARGVQKMMQKSPRMAQKASRIASHMDDAARIASRADDATRMINRTQDAESLINKLGGRDAFDDAVDSFRRDWAKSWPESSLTPSEWDDLNRSLRKDNLEFIEDYGRRTLVEYTPDNVAVFADVDAQDIIRRAKKGERVFVDVGDNREPMFKVLMQSNDLDYDVVSMRVFKPDEVRLHEHTLNDFERYTPKAQTVSQPNKVLSNDYNSGVDRIQNFKEKYDVSSRGRMQRSLDEWDEIFNRELGHSDIEYTYREDFKKDYETLQNTLKRYTTKSQLNDFERYTPKPQTVSQPSKVLSNDYNSGVNRIQNFKEKYDVSSRGRMQRSLDEWDEIFDKELGYSDIEYTYRDDFKKDYKTLLQNYGLF